MRFIAAFLPGGRMLMIAVLANCGGTEASSIDPVPDGSVVTYLTPPQLCTDACVLISQICGSTTDYCATKCEDEYRLGGPECQDQYVEAYTCELSTLQAQVAANMAHCVGQMQCDSSAALHVCQYTYGCKGPWGPPCNSVPGEPGACLCQETCQQKLYRSVCRPDGTTTTCDCSVDEVPVGTCDGGAELFCDYNMVNGCCNQYFMLKF